MSIHHSHGGSRRSFLHASAGAALLGVKALGQAPQLTEERFREWSEEIQSKGIAAPFKGVTTKGEVEQGLFPLLSTGVSTEPVRNGFSRP